MLRNQYLLYVRNVPNEARIFDTNDPLEAICIQNESLLDRVIERDCFYKVFCRIFLCPLSKTQCLNYLLESSVLEFRI